MVKNYFNVRIVFTISLFILLLVRSNPVNAQNKMDLIIENDWSVVSDQLISDLLRFNQIYKTAVAHQSGEKVLTEKELLILMEEAEGIMNIDETFENIKWINDNAFFAMFVAYLPKQLVAFWNQAIPIAYDDALSGKEKIEALVKATGSNCEYYIMIIGYCNLIALGLLTLSLLVVTLIITVPLMIITAAVEILAFFAWIFCLIGII